MGKFTVMALEKTGRRLTSSKFLQAIKQTKKFFVDEFSLKYGEKDNQGSDKVFLTSIFKGKLFSISDLKTFRNEQNQ